MQKLYSNKTRAKPDLRVTIWKIEAILLLVLLAGTLGSRPVQAVGFLHTSAERVLPDALRDHGVGDTFTLIYAYHANDPLGDPWKMYDPLALPYAIDLNPITAGWGYWIKVTSDSTWNINYLADLVIP